MGGGQQSEYDCGWVGREDCAMSVRGEDEGDIRRLERSTDGIDCDASSNGNQSFRNVDARIEFESLM